jgi:uncharacterized membrane protein
MLNSRLENRRDSFWLRLLVQAAPLLFVLLIGLTLRLWGLGDRSLWGDEFFVLYATQGSLADIVFPTLLDRGTMVLFYGAAHLWVNAVAPALPPNEFLLRLLPAAFSAATIPAMYFLAKRIASVAYPQISAPRVGVLAAGFYALSPFAVRYAQEFRAYSLQVLLLTLASLALISALHPADQNSQAKRWWIAYAVLSALAMYAHFFASLIIVAQISGASLFIALRRSRGLFGGLSLALTTLAITTLPLLLTVVQDGGTRLSWIEPLNLFSVLRTSGFLLGVSVDTRGALGLLLPALLALPAMLFVILGLVQSLKKETARPIRVITLLVPLFVPPLLLAVISIAVKPVWVDRYLLQLLIPTAVLFAIGAATLLEPKGASARSANTLVKQGGALLLGLATTFTLISAAITLTTHQSEDWKAVAESIDTRCPSESTLRIGYSGSPPKLARDLETYLIRVDGYSSQMETPSLPAGFSLCLISTKVGPAPEFSAYLARLAAEIGPMTEYPGTPAVYHFQTSAP